MSAFGRTDVALAPLLIAAFSAVAAVTDLIWGRIFNAFNVTMLVCGLGFSLAQGGWAGLASGLLGALAGLLLYGWMFAIKVMGGGDVKFLMALGAWGGFGYVLEVALLGVLLGGVMAFATLLFKGRLGPFARRMRRFLLTLFVKELELETPKIDRSQTMPFGVPIAVAAVWVAYLHPLRAFLMEMGVR